MVEQIGVCCVQLCMTGRVAGQELMCHKFPEKGVSKVPVTMTDGTTFLMDRREVWQGIVGVDWITNDVMVCARHFRSTDYTLHYNDGCPVLYLNLNAVPSCDIPGRSHIEINQSNLVIEVIDHEGRILNYTYNQIPYAPTEITNTNLVRLENMSNYCAFPVSNQPAGIENVPPTLLVEHSNTSDSNHNLVCCVYGCPSSSSDNNTTLMFHKFPDRGRHMLGETTRDGIVMSMDRRDLWRAITRQANVMPWTRVCSNHFRGVDYTETPKGPLLNIIAIPRLNIPRMERKGVVQMKSDDGKLHEIRLSSLDKAPVAKDNHMISQLRSSLNKALMSAQRNSADDGSSRPAPKKSKNSAKISLQSGSKRRRTHLKPGSRKQRPRRVVIKGKNSNSEERTAAESVIQDALVNTNSHSTESKSIEDGDGVVDIKNEPRDDDIIEIKKLVIDEDKLTEVDGVNRPDALFNEGDLPDVNSFKNMMI